jgi:cell division protein ZapE
MVPPPRFDGARFDTYVPDPAQPSQAAAVEALTASPRTLQPQPKRLFGRAEAPAGRPGVYLDGGYGVGKTHLLASLWHDAPGPQAYGTFVELTHLVGALGFAPTVEALSATGCWHRRVRARRPGRHGAGLHAARPAGRRGRARRRHVQHAARLARRGRFAAQDFLREIQGLSAHFAPLRVDGEDYRHRGQPRRRPPVATTRCGAGRGDPGASYDAFDALVAHLSTLHPSRYGALVDDVTLLCVTGVQPVATRRARCGWSCWPTGSTTATCRC